MSCRLSRKGLEVGTAMAVALRLDGFAPTAEMQAAPLRLETARRVAVCKAILQRYRGVIASRWRKVVPRLRKSKCRDLGMCESYRLETTLVYIRRVRGICNKAGHTDSRSIAFASLFLVGSVSYHERILKVVYRT